MNTEIIIALIGACGAALGSLLGIFANGNLTAYRLQQLEEKVDKHNNLVERTYEIETDIEVIKNDIKVANHRISDLEKKGS